MPSISVSYHISLTLSVPHYVWQFATPAAKTACVGLLYLIIFMKSLNLIDIQKILFMCKVKANNGLDGVLTLMASPGLFYNECEISFKVTIVPLCED